MEEMKRRQKKSILLPQLSLNTDLDNNQLKKDEKLTESQIENLTNINNASSVKEEILLQRYSSRCGIQPENYLNESAALLMNSITTTSGISTTMNSSVLDEFQDEPKDLYSYTEKFEDSENNNENEYYISKDLIEIINCSGKNDR